APSAAARAYQLRALEGDHCSIAFDKPHLTAEEARCRHDRKTHPFELPQRGLVPLVREDDARPQRHEVATGRPLLALLHGTLVAAAEDRLDGHVAARQCSKNVR